MTEKNNALLPASMSNGLAMGAYWVVKYVFNMFSLSLPLLAVVYWLLSLLVPYVGYVLTKRYKADLGGQITFGQAWRFGVLVYFFAALIVSVMHYVFYRYVAPPDYVANAVGQALATLQEMQASPETMRAIASMSFSPIQMALQGILNNILYGIIFSLPVAALVCRKG